MTLISNVTGYVGLDDSDEQGDRHRWRIAGVEIVAVSNPHLDDDQGIPFSRFDIEVDFCILDMQDLEHVVVFRLALAKLLGTKLRRHPGTINVALVRNLQNEMPID